MKRRAIIRADAAPGLGGGHVMRCLTLARVLIARGWQVDFATNDGAEAIVPALASGEVRHIPGFEMGMADVTRLKALAEPQPDLLVIDHYRSSPEFEAACSGLAQVQLVVDDFATPSQVAQSQRVGDLVLNTNIGADAQAYRGRVPPAATVLAGAEFALLRAEFAAAGEARMATRTEPSHVKRVALSFGFTDAGKITARVAERLLAHHPDLAITAVMGPQAAGLAEIKALAAQNAAISVHVDPPDMAGLLSAVDLAIGAAGQSSYERCCLGLPSIAVAVADNQEFLVAELAKAGAALPLNAARAGWETAFDAALAALMGDIAARKKMAKSARALCDGRGAERVASAIEARLAGSSSPLEERG